MKQKLLLGLLLILFLKSFAQDSKFSFELNYPIPFGENGIGENFDGIIDLGANFKFFNSKNFNLLTSLNGGLLKRKEVQGVQVNKGNFYLLQPRISAELNLQNFEKLHIELGIGYTFTFFELSANFNGFNEVRSESNDGVNINFGIAYDIVENLFFNIQYDFIKIGASENAPDIKYNTNINLFKIGIGYRI